MKNDSMRHFLTASRSKKRVFHPERSPALPVRTFHPDKKGDVNVSNQLTKADAARKQADSSLTSALRYGGPLVWLSCLVMGAGNLFSGQIIKGLIYLAIEVLFLCLMLVPMIPDMQGVAYSGIDWLKKFPSLGDTPDMKVYNEETFLYETQYGDRSHLILLYGVVFAFVIVCFIVIWRASVRSGYQALSLKKAGVKPNTFVQDVKSLFDENVHKTLMFLPFMALVIFTIIPLAYMICMAFTNYCDTPFVVNGVETTHLNLFDWVGLDNFRQLFDSSSVIAKQFWSVLGWTLIWAFFATFLNFFLGTFVAMMINRPTTRLKGLWRTILSLTIAVPQFVSLMLISKMFADNSIVNKMLIDLGLIDTGIRFMSVTNNARIFVIVINLWVGIPYTIMQVTGILKNIPAEQYEAATIDGANVVQQFMNITLPYMIFVMTPYIITSFTGNINNFNVIFLLTGGGPFTLEGSAGKTDLLVTWLYRLSVEKNEYNLAAVIGIFTFIILAIVSLVTYRSSGSYKDEEGFK